MEIDWIILYHVVLQVKTIMDKNTQKEEFSYAYIYAITSAAGYALQRANTPLDQIGIDLIITGDRRLGILKLPQLLVQVKCTSRSLMDDNYLRYPLKVKNYQELRISAQYPPIILVVVVVPDEPDDWLQQSQNELCLKYCGYWISLAGQPATANEQTVTVQISRQNLFDVPSLKNMMQRIGRGEIL